MAARTGRWCAGAFLALASVACATAVSAPPPRPPDVELGFARITVFSEGPEAARVAAALRAAGYPNVTISEDVDVDLNVKFGGVSEPTIDHLVHVTAQTIGVDPARFRRSRPWPKDDGEVYINVSSFAVCEALPDCRPVSVEGLRDETTVFVHSDLQLGAGAAERLAGAGYQAVTQDRPLDQLTIQYGGAPVAVVADVVRSMADATGCDLGSFVIRHSLGELPVVRVHLGRSGLARAGCPPEGDAALARSPNHRASTTVVVFSDGAEAETVAAKLRQAGYGTVRVSRDVDLDLNVKHGGVSPVIVKEVLRLTADALGLSPRRFRVDAPFDKEGLVHVNVARFAVCRARPGCKAVDQSAQRARLRVEVRSDLPLRDEVVSAIGKAGFPNARVASDPADHLRAEYGEAPPALVRDAIDVATELTGCPLGRFLIRKALDRGDPRVRIHLPLVAMKAAACLPSAPPARVVVLSDRDGVAEGVARRLAEDGYPEVSAAGFPREEPSIAHGLEAEAAAARVRALVADQVGLRPSRVVVRPDRLVPKGTVFVHLPAAELGPPCGQPESDPDFRGAELGATVVLGRHRTVRGEDSWRTEMEAFIGRRAVVREQVGVDGRGCPVVRVDVDEGRYYWRVRDLEVVEGESAI